MGFDPSTFPPAVRERLGIAIATKTAREPRFAGPVSTRKKQWAKAYNTVPVVKDGVVTLELPMRLVSLVNHGGGIWDRANRAKEQRGTVYACLSRVKFPAPPLAVTVTRIGKRKLDECDNLRISAKHVIDGIADALGIDDGDGRVVYDVRQEVGKEYGVRVAIAPTGGI